MIYQSDRPNWRSKYLSFSCNYSYGNPSGHSFTSIALFLSLAHILVNYYKIKGIFKEVIFIIFILFSFLIMSSRVILGSHSIDQVLYGFTLGLSLYFILIHIIGYHKYSSIDFFQHIRNKRVNYIYIIFHISLILFTIYVYFLTESKGHFDLEKNIFNGIKCEKKYPISKYKNDALFQSLSIVSLLGAQSGINLLLYFLRKNNYIINFSIIKWNKSGNRNFMLRIPIILLSSSAIILYFIIPNNLPLIIIFIFKSVFPFFLSLIGINCFGIYLCIYLNLANTEIYKMEVLQELFSYL
jgi:membrane-associated phospholipid phosphatase